MIPTLTVATLKLEASPMPSGRIHVVLHSATGPQELFMSADEWSTLSLYDRALDAAEQLINHLKGQRDRAVADVARLDELHLGEIRRLDLERAKLAARVRELEGKQAAFGEAAR